METINIWENIVCFDEFNLENKSDLKEFLESDKLKQILLEIQEKVILVLGWDWTMLRSIIENYKKQLPFLWLNFWSKWFLLNDRNYVYPRFQYLKRKYPLIEVEIKWENFKSNQVAMNEIDIRSNTWRIISLDLSLKDNQSLTLEWDWLIICTPAWSTWYNSSLWWSIIPHTLESFVITPKAPWKPKWQAPILIENSEELLINNSWRKNEIQLNSDWRTVFESKQWEELNIRVFKSRYEVDLIIANDYKKIWDNKVLSEQWFNIK